MYLSHCFLIWLKCPHLFLQPSQLERRGHIWGLALPALSLAPSRLTTAD